MIYILLSRPYIPRPNSIFEMDLKTIDMHLKTNNNFSLPFQNRKRVNKMGNLCAFFEIPVHDSDLSIGGKSGHAGAYVNLQSAANPNWYLGFGPTKSSNGGHRGRALTPEGYEVLMPRRMSPKMTNHVRKDKCDFKFSTGKYSPDNMNHDWSGLYETIGYESAVAAAKLRALEKNSIEKIRENDINEDQEEDDDDFDRKLTGSRNRYPTSNDLSSSSSARTKVQEKISETSLEDDVPPLPSPLALRRRKVKKFRRKESPSYFYDHNRRRDDSKTSLADAQSPIDSMKTPLFSSLL